MTEAEEQQCCPSWKIAYKIKMWFLFVSIIELDRVSAWFTRPQRKLLRANERSLMVNQKWKYSRYNVRMGLDIIS